MLVAPHPPPPPRGMVPLRYTPEILVRVVTVVSKVPSHRDGPEPAIFVTVVAFEAMQLRGVSKVATPTWAMVSVCAAPSC